MPSRERRREARRLDPEASYTAGIGKRVDLVLAPWFVIFGGLFYGAMLLWPMPPSSDPVPAGLILAYPVFMVAGFVLGYFAYFRRTYRVVIVGDVLFWFLPFHRLRGERAISSIVAIQRERVFPWKADNTVIIFSDGRTIAVPNRAGIREFVFALRSISPGISVGEWFARHPTGNAYSALRMDDDDIDGTRRLI